MDNNTLQYLTELASKLGTTTEYLWGVLLKQAPISGVIEFVVMSAWVVAVVMWAKFVQQKTTKPEPTNENRYTSAEWTEEGVFFSWASVFILAVIVADIVGSGLSTTVAALFNPEYWALKQILN